MSVMQIYITQGGLPAFVGSCVSCIVARAGVCNPKNKALIWIFADLSPVILLSIAVFKLARIALHLKTGPGQQKSCK